MGFGSDGIGDPIVPEEGAVESAIDEGVLGDVVEAGTAEIPVYSFKSFEELKAAVEADPPTHDALGLYNYVQTRLQRPGPLALLAEADLQKSYDGYVPWFRATGVFGSPMTFDEYAELARIDRVEHAWLKDALVKLEERAFGAIRRGPALGSDVTCVYYEELIHARVESRGRLPDGTEVFYTDVLRNGTRLGFRADLQGKCWISGRHEFNSAEAQALLVASADPSLPSPEFWAGAGQAERQFETREAAQASVLDELSGMGGGWENVLDFEAAWHDRMGGVATTDLRFVIGISMAQLVTKHGVHPRALADYLREALRLSEPDKFDKPS